jgi:hypothetical protein
VRFAEPTTQNHKVPPGRCRPRISALHTETALPSPIRRLRLGYNTPSTHHDSKRQGTTYSAIAPSPLGPTTQTAQEQAISTTNLNDQRGTTPVRESELEEAWVSEALQDVARRVCVDGEQLPDALVGENLAAGGVDERDSVDAAQVTPSLELVDTIAFA